MLPVLLRCWAAWAMAKPKFLGEDLFLEWEGLQT
jgi:hypothetical protein